MEIEYASRLSTLGHPQRLALFRLLMRRYPDRVPAGELSGALGLKPSTLSAYLAALMQAGLVVQERVATSLRYTVDMAEARRTFDYLLLDCCRGRPELCSPAALPARPADAGPARHSVLFICTGNSARSIFAESILRHEAGDRFTAYSAGLNPRAAVHPLTLDTLRRNGHDIAPLRPKTIAEVQGDDAPAFDFVFTVCDQAANEECPAWPGQPISAHWGLPDPARAEGSDAERALAFRTTYAALLNRIKAFASLPISTLDRVSLQQAVDDLARMKPEDAP